MEVLRYFSASCMLICIVHSVQIIRPHNSKQASLSTDSDTSKASRREHILLCCGHISCVRNETMQNATAQASVMLREQVTKKIDIIKSLQIKENQTTVSKNISIVKSNISSVQNTNNDLKNVSVSISSYANNRKRDRNRINNLNVKQVNNVNNKHTTAATMIKVSSTSTVRWKDDLRNQRNKNKKNETRHGGQGVHPNNRRKTTVGKRSTTVKRIQTKFTRHTKFNRKTTLVMSSSNTVLTRSTKPPNLFSSTYLTTIRVTQTTQKVIPNNLDYTTKKGNPTRRNRWTNMPIQNLNLNLNLDYTRKPKPIVNTIAARPSNNSFDYVKVKTTKNSKNTRTTLKLRPGIRTTRGRTNFFTTNKLLPTMKPVYTRSTFKNVQATTRISTISSFVSRPHLLPDYNMYHPSSSSDRKDRFTTSLNTESSNNWGNWRDKTTEESDDEEEDDEDVGSKTKVTMNDRFPSRPAWGDNDGGWDTTSSSWDSDNRNPWIETTTMKWGNDARNPWENGDGDSWSTPNSGWGNDNRDSWPYSTVSSGWGESNGNPNNGGWNNPNKDSWDDHTTGGWNNGGGNGGWDNPNKDSWGTDKKDSWDDHTTGGWNNGGGDSWNANSGWGTDKTNSWNDHTNGAWGNGGSSSWDTNSGWGNNNRDPSATTSFGWDRSNSNDWGTSKSELGRNTDNPWGTTIPSNVGNNGDHADTSSFWGTTSEMAYTNSQNWNVDRGDNPREEIHGERESNNFAASSFTNNFPSENEEMHSTGSTKNSNFNEGEPNNKPSSSAGGPGFNPEKTATRFNGDDDEDNPGPPRNTGINSGMTTQKPTYHDDEDEDDIRNPPYPLPPGVSTMKYNFNEDEEDDEGPPRPPGGPGSNSGMTTQKPTFHEDGDEDDIRTPPYPIPPGVSTKKYNFNEDEEDDEGPPRPPGGAGSNSGITTVKSNMGDASGKLVQSSSNDVSKQTATPLSASGVDISLNKPSAITSGDSNTIQFYGLDSYIEVTNKLSIPGSSTEDETIRFYGLSEYISNTVIK